MASAFNIRPIEVSAPLPASLPPGTAQLGSSIPSIARFIAAFEELASDLVTITDKDGREADEADHAARAYRAAKSTVLMRRRREKAFGTDLFADPVWNILLDLFVSHHEGKDVSVGDACIAADVPVTSALRWCRILEMRGCIRRERDPLDGRRVFVRLTDNTMARMQHLFLAGTGSNAPTHDSQEGVSNGQPS
jgi:hypothetical protein